MFMTKFTATTAVCAVLAGTAWAQSQTDADTMQNTAAMQTTDIHSVQVSEKQILGTDLMGGTVYTNPGPTGEAVGDVDDLLISQDGEIAGLIIGVGGFLEIGEKNVAVPFDKVEQNRDDQGMLYLTLATNRDQLQSAPDFDYGTVRPSADLQTDISRDSDTALDRSNRFPGEETAPTRPKDQMAGEGSSRAPDIEDRMADNAFAQSPAGMAWRDTKPVSHTNLRADELLDAVVYGESGDEIGDIGDVILRPQGEVQAYIVDVGGFLGIGEKEVAIASQNLNVRRDGDDFAVFTPFSETELEGQKTYDAEAFADNPDNFLMR
ncbi:PRC-barrel domain-containing protein [Martelella lutilitoris]|uniref:PRC-barrel domain-containing protein n=1 Tax=Martelella lutilitoris TaxID=2583532 RepID=A0A7T7HN86_9HYPH|nr:PRC-barrel domain-containing protein [Martelella lutilitoris]QQM32173.1 PRC-barrel domain-containing protein [Martelella lutilitoris]